MSEKNVLNLKVIDGDGYVLKPARIVVGVPYIFVYRGRIIFLWRRLCRKMADIDIMGW